jgi:DNA-directed RNA polymerase III subunit RPC3
MENKYAHVLVSAALRYVASKKHNSNNRNSDNNNNTTIEELGMDGLDDGGYEMVQVLQSDTFTPTDIQNFLPPPIKEELKKNGGLQYNLQIQLNKLCNLQNPRIVGRITASSDGGAGMSTYVVKTKDIIDYIHDCQQHQFITTRLGDEAARICSILKDYSYLESDLVAEKAMMPTKDARDVLHRLFRQGYIGLLNLNQGKQYNTSSMIYLWEYNRKKIIRKVSDDVCTALLNMRLRRQHEITRGAQFMDRAANAGQSDFDENEHKADLEERRKFAVGIQRLDNAILSLDELSMTFEDFHDVLVR